jgi:hypothetical protein
LHQIHAAPALLENNKVNLSGRQLTKGRLHRVKSRRLVHQPPTRDKYS